METPSSASNGVRRCASILAVIACAAACSPSAPAPSQGDARAAAPAPAAAAKDYNLLFVSFDTTRADRVSCYGNPRKTTPNVDRLAADGQRFERAYTPMPTTLPSHASMFTSLHPLELGVHRNREILSERANTLAERLKAAGFATGAFVAAVPLLAQFGLNQGFDVYDEPADTEARRADEVGAKALSWIEAHAGERFFCFVHFFDAHAPYDPPAEARARFGVPEGVFAGTPRSDTGFVISSRKKFVEKSAAAKLAYEAEISHADEELGHVLDQLDARGLREKTIVLFTADHGETLDELFDATQYAFDHGEFLHGRELHIPFVLWLPPGQPLRGPAVHPEVVSTLDYMPTLLELLHLPCAGPISGRSLVPLLAGGSLPGVPAVSCRHDLNSWMPAKYPREQFSLVDGSWNLIESPKSHELYDLDSDPAGTRDVSAEHPDRVEAMSRAIENWRKVHGQPIWGDAELSSDPAAAAALEKLGY